MKKLILLLSVCTLVFTSCGSDDDASSSQDQIVGTWKYFKYLENGVEQPLEPCETEETTVYSADGTASVVFYDLDANDDCVASFTFSGVWENVGNGSYSFSANGDSVIEELIFDGNTYYYEYIYDNDTPEDTSDDIVERDVYIRQ